MITDPVSGVNALGLQEYRVIRGSCIFTLHEDLQDFGGAAGRAAWSVRFPRDEGRGLRLSLTLPCNGAGSVVQ